jgi:hypothetical protein
VGSSSGAVWKHQRTFTISKLRDFGFGKRSFESSIMEEIEMFMNLMESYKGAPFDIANIILSYFMATSFSGGRSRSTRREPPTMGKQALSLVAACRVHLFLIYKDGREPVNPHRIGDRLL